MKRLARESLTWVRSYLQVSSRKNARRIRPRSSTGFSAIAAEVQQLESRALLSAASVPVAVSNLVVAHANSTPGSQPYTPTQIREAYGFNQVSFGNVAGTGAGQTIAIVDANNDPNIAADLAVFDQTYGIAAPPKLSVVNQTGGTALPSTDAGWSLEESLDVEWAHAMAPGASIMLVEANSSSLTDLLAAVNYAKNASGVSVVSMSWGSSDFSGEAAYDSSFTTPAGHQGVTFVASAGDSAAIPEWPAVSPNVLSVGGTTLNLVLNNATGQWSRSSETAWNSSGGGNSAFETEPAYQKPVQSSGFRSSPDVAYDANPNTGFSVYDTVGSNGGWMDVGGTSAGAPQWAAIIAIADQGRVINGLPTMSQPNATIYSLSSSNFIDITSGSAGKNTAGVGYDLVTGLGSPVVNMVIPQLAGTASSPAPVGTPANVTVTATSTTTVQITWGLASGATGYRVYQVNSSGSTTLVATLGATVTSDSVTGQTPGAKESFKVEAFNATSIADSAVVSVTMPSPPPATLKAPTVTVSNVTSTTAVLSWNSVSGTQGYRIYYINSSNQRVLLGTVNASTTAIQIVGMTPGSTFTFIIEAFNASSVADSALIGVTTANPNQRR